jgi:hypothetical protein
MGRLLSFASIRQNVFEVPQAGCRAGFRLVASNTRKPDLMGVGGSFHPLRGLILHPTHVRLIPAQSVDRELTRTGAVKVRRLANALDKEQCKRRASPIATSTSLTQTAEPQSQTNHNLPPYWTFNSTRPGPVEDSSCGMRRHGPLHALMTSPSGSGDGCMLSAETSDQGMVVAWLTRKESPAPHWWLAKDSNPRSRAHRPSASWTMDEWATAGAERGNARPEILRIAQGRSRANTKRPKPCPGSLLPTWTLALCCSC